MHQREQLAARSVRQLELLLGRYPSGRLETEASLPAASPDVPVGLPAELVSRRPDLAAAERRIAASHARVLASRRALYPRISLTASGGTSSTELSNLLDGDFGIWTLLGNIVQPLFSGGRLRANLDLAKTQEDINLALFAQTALTAFAEVENALTDVRALASRQEALEAAVEQSSAARRISEERYASGLTDLITMLTAQRAAYAQESQLLTVRRLRLDAQIDLHLALGGGFPTPSTDRTETLEPGAL
jgi:NodT family efflux transporter outer membrane factor (OMF) lipoprotein